jgi:hypothetical protein
MIAAFGNYAVSDNALRYVGTTVLISDAMGFQSLRSFQTISFYNSMELQLLGHSVLSTTQHGVIQVCKPHGIC